MFFVFRDSNVLCIYVMNILCTFRISVSGYGTKLLTNRGGLRGVVAKVLHFDIIVSEVEFQSCNYIHFQIRIRTLG